MGFYQWGGLWNEVPFHDEEAVDLDLDRNCMWQGIPECCAEMSEKFRMGDDATPCSGGAFIRAKTGPVPWRSSANTIRWGTQL